MNDKRKSASPSAIQVKNCRKTIDIEKKLHVITRLEKGEGIVDKCRNIRLAHSTIHTILDNADRIKENAKSGTKVFVCVARLPQAYPNEPYQKTMDLKRYKTYAYLLRSRISQYPELEPSLVETCIGEVDESGTVTLMEAAAAVAVVGGDGGGIVSPTVPDRRASPTTNRKKNKE